jgi:hypothetical protein
MIWGWKKQVINFLYIHKYGLFVVMLECTCDVMFSGVLRAAKCSLHFVSEINIFVLHILLFIFAVLFAL